MSRDVRLYLEDIERACDKVQRFTSGFDLGSFIQAGRDCSAGTEGVPEVVLCDGRPDCYEAEDEVDCPD